MARETIRRCTLEKQILMAARASNCRVTTRQFERRTVMIETRRFPSIYRMTGNTICTQFALMRIISLMTGETVLVGRLQLDDRMRIHMTFRAWQTGMLSIKRKTKLVVVEIIAVGVQTVVTVKTGIAECDLMVSHEDGSSLDVAFLTRRCIKARHVLPMTITA